MVTWDFEYVPPYSLLANASLYSFSSQDSAGVTADISKDAYSQIIAKHPDTILTLNHETVETTVYADPAHSNPDLFTFKLSVSSHPDTK